MLICCKKKERKKERGLQLWLVILMILIAVQTKCNATNIYLKKEVSRKKTIGISKGIKEFGNNIKDKISNVFKSDNKGIKQEEIDKVLLILNSTEKNISKEDINLLKKINNNLPSFIPSYIIKTSRISSVSSFSRWNLVAIWSFYSFMLIITNIIGGWYNIPFSEHEFFKEQNKIHKFRVGRSDIALKLFYICKYKNNERIFPGLMIAKFFSIIIIWPIEMIYSYFTDKKLYKFTHKNWENSKQNTMPFYIYNLVIPQYLNHSFGETLYKPRFSLSDVFFTTCFSQISHNDFIFLDLLSCMRPVLLICKQLFYLIVILPIIAIMPMLIALGIKSTIERIGRREKSLDKNTIEEIKKRLKKKEEEEMEIEYENIIINRIENKKKKEYELKEKMNMSLFTYKVMNHNKLINVDKQSFVKSIVNDIYNRFLRHPSLFWIPIITSGALIVFELSFSLFFVYHKRKCLNQHIDSIENRPNKKAYYCIVKDLYCEDNPQEQKVTYLGEKEYYWAIKNSQPYK